MAITGSDAKIVSDAQTALHVTKVDNTIFGSTIGTGSGMIFRTEGSPLAGVTPEMASNIATAIETYETNIKGILAKLTNIESSSAFKGTQLQSALSTFIESVKATANEFMDKLTAAENEIVTSVAAAYAEQDTDLNSQLASDASNISLSGN